MLRGIRVSWYLHEPDIHVNGISRWFLCSLENFILSIIGSEFILMHIHIWPVLLKCFFFWYFAFFEHLNGWEWQEVLAEKQLVRGHDMHQKCTQNEERCGYLVTWYTSCCPTKTPPWFDLSSTGLGSWCIFSDTRRKVWSLSGTVV